MSSSSSEDEDTMNMLPEIVPVSSLASFSDSTVSSSGRASPASLSVSPPRSIFHNFWASPKCSSREGSEGSQAPTATFEKASAGDKERELLHKLSSLSLPLVDDDEQPSSTDMCASNSLTRSSSAQTAPSPKMVDAKAFRRPSFDDSTINYGRDKKNPSASTPRRKILPTVVAPPPPPAAPAIKYDARVSRVAPLREQTQRPWSSTTALIKRPTHSCLRPSRYSCSMIDERKLAQHRRDASEDAAATAAAAIAARAAMSRSKSVSFYSQVSVFEFVNYGKGVEDVQPSKDWSKDWSKYFGS